MKELEVSADGVSVTLSVQPANVMLGLLRNNKQAEAKDEISPLRWFARYWIFAACVSCSEGEITQGEKVTPVSELSFDEYYALSDAITIPWLNTVFEVNPHWMPSEPPSKEEKKKA
jgi:hypothetical protein